MTFIFVAGSEGTWIWWCCCYQSRGHITS